MGQPTLSLLGFTIRLSNGEGHEEGDSVGARIGSLQAKQNRFKVGLLSFTQKLFFSTYMYLGILVFYSFHSHYCVTNVLYINEPPKGDLFKLSIYFLLFVLYFLKCWIISLYLLLSYTREGMKQLQEDYLQENQVDFLLECITQIEKKEHVAPSVGRQLVWR